MTSRNDEQILPLGGELARRLGLGTATALVIGQMIGVGIFLTPAGMARSLGSPFWLLAVWLVMGLVTLSGALCFGTLAARYPESGGIYVYLRQAYGPRTAFLYAWASLLILDPGLTAMLAMGLSKYAGYLTPLTAAGEKGVAIGAIVVLALVNIIGVGLGARVLSGLTLLKLGVLGVIVFWGVGSARGDWSRLTPFLAQRPGSDPLAQGILGGFIGAFFSFAGWWDLSKLAGEVREPRRNMPRALILGVVIVTAVYVAVTLVFLYLVPLGRVASDETFAAQAGEVLFGRAGGTVFSAAVIVSVLGSLAGVLMSAPRVYYAMARDGVLRAGIEGEPGGPRGPLASLATVHPRLGTPLRAIALQAALACGFVAAGTFRQILASIVFVMVIFLVMTVASIFTVGRGPAEAGAQRVPGYPVTPLVFLVPISLLPVLFAVQDPLQACLGLGVVAAGIPVARLLHPAKRREQSAQLSDVMT